MSYDKAMKHWRNPRKYKKSQPLHFDTGTGQWQSPRRSPAVAAIMDIKHWFKHRHSSEDVRHTRECIRDRIAEYRAMGRAEGRA